jgi:hypothetical protein
MLPSLTRLLLELLDDLIRDFLGSDGVDEVMGGGGV